MTEFRFLNGDVATLYVAPVAVRLWAANGWAAHAAPSLTPQEPTPENSRRSAEVFPQTASLDGQRIDPDRRSANPDRQSANPDRQHEIRQQIAELSRQHRELDEQVRSVPGNDQTKSDELSLRRLKKKKLMLKDWIAALQMQLVPDIPA